MDHLLSKDDRDPGPACPQVGDRIGPPPHGAWLTPAPPEGPRPSICSPSTASSPLPRRARGAASAPRGGCPAPWPAAGPAATPHVRGGAFFDNPVSARVRADLKSAVRAQYSSPNRRGPGRVGRGSSLLLWWPSVARRAGRRDDRVRAGRGVRARGLRVTGRACGVGSAWSSPQGHGGDA